MLTYDSAPGGSGSIPLSGFVTLPAVHFVPTVVDVGAMQAGTSTIRMIELRNDGATPVALQDPQVIGPGFSLGSTTCTSTLAAGSSCNVSVSLAPVVIGPASGLVQVAADGAMFAAPLRTRGARELKVSKTGNGGGRISGISAGIDCGATCRALVTSDVTLIATPDANSALTGWSIPSCGAKTMCTVPIDVFPTTVTATFVQTEAANITLAFAGTGAGDARVVELDGPVVANCYSTCTVPVQVGMKYDIEASTWSVFSGFSSACTATAVSGNCNVMATAGTTTVTVSFNKRAGERYTRFLPGLPIATKLDADENLIIATDNQQVLKLTPQGTTQWTLPFAASMVDTGPQDSIYVKGTLNSFTGLFKLDANGAVQWRVAIPDGYGDGAAGMSTFASSLAVASDGSIVSVGANGIARWDSAGNVAWTKPLAFATVGGVGIQPDGTIVVGHTTGDSLNPTVTGERFAPADGAALSSLGVVGTQWRGDLEVDSTGQVATYNSGSSLLAFQWRSQTANKSITGDLFLPTGTCVTGAGSAVYVSNRRNNTGWNLGRMAADGTVLETGGGDLFTAYGFGTQWLNDIACSRTRGAYVVAGEYSGFADLSVLTDSSVGYVQLVDL